MEAYEGWKYLILGLMLIAGFLAHLGGPMIHVPRVTLLLLLGAIAGQGVLDLVPDETTAWFPFFSHLALAIVGFLLGEEFRLEDLRQHGKRVLAISVGETVAAAALVFVAVYAWTQDLVFAMVLAGIAPASAPAAIFETVREGRARGELTDTVLGVVAVDDAWGVIAFSILLVAATAVGGGGTAGGELLTGLWEVFGAVALGIAVGLPMAWISGRIRGGQITLVEASGFILLQTGVAVMIGVSYLLAAIVLGATVVNLAKQERPFKAVKGVREPFLAIFFILAGLKLEPDKLVGVGVIGAVYMLARACGLGLGGWATSRMIGLDSRVGRRVGWCIMPQAGVAIGFALLAQQKLPGIGDTVLTLVIGTTVIFEIVGPLVARLMLHGAGEWNRDRRQGGKSTAG